MKELIKTGLGIVCITIGLFLLFYPAATIKNLTIQVFLSYYYGYLIDAILLIVWGVLNIKNYNQTGWLMNLYAKFEKYLEEEDTQRESLVKKESEPYGGFNIGGVPKSEVKSKKYCIVCGKELPLSTKGYYNTESGIKEIIYDRCINNKNVAHILYKIKIKRQVQKEYAKKHPWQAFFNGLGAAISSIMISISAFILIYYICTHFTCNKSINNYSTDEPAPTELPLE